MQFWPFSRSSTSTCIFQFHYELCSPCIIPLGIPRILSFWAVLGLLYFLYTILWVGLNCLGGMELNCNGWINGFVSCDFMSFE